MDYMRRDIIVFDFIDHYENLTLKTMMGMKWATEMCPKVQSVLKIDDDMTINTPKYITNKKYSVLRPRYVVPLKIL